MWGRSEEGGAGGGVLALGCRRRSLVAGIVVSSLRPHKVGSIFSWLS